MRLALFTSQFPSRVSTFFARDLRALLDAGVEVDVFPIYSLDVRLWQYVPEILSPKVFPRHRVHHLSLGRSLRLWRPWPARRMKRLAHDAAAVGLSALPYGILPVAKSFYTFPKACAWARQRSAKDYDHVLAYWGNYAATCACVFHRLLDRDIPFSMFLHAGTDLYRTQVYLSQKLLYADNIFVVCEFNREFLRHRYPRIYPRIAEKIHLHHLGLNLDDLPFQPGGRSPRRVLGVARFSWHKGFEYLLRAVGKLAARGVNVEVDLIGDGEGRKSLETLTRRLGIGRQVQFLGWLPFADVQAAMARAALLVHPSPDIGDGVPTVIKEAQALGTPVVGTRVAGIPELLDHGRCGMVVPPKDAGALAEAIALLLADEALRRRYAHAARQHAENLYDMWRNGLRLAAMLRTTVRRLRDGQPPSRRPERPQRILPRSHDASLRP
ncbi:MAG: glycosyltransferase [Pirellulales bacterium]|nr:glycosyltransferase [Pirellulales bacterium]